MDCRKQLNKNAAIMKFEKSRTGYSLEEFFTVLFTSWNEENVGMIISSIRAETKEELKIIYKELFITIYNLASQSETKMKAANATLAINTLDTFLPEILIESSIYSENPIEEYNAIKSDAYQNCFQKIKLACILFSQLSSKTMLLEIKNVLLILSNLSQMFYFEKFVYDFANLLWELIQKYRANVDLCEIFLFSMSNISDKLFTFLLINLDLRDTTKAFRELALVIYSSLKSELIESKFITREIIYVLNILEKHDRFIGQYADAIPENMFYEGCIVCNSQTKSFETDEVYEDFEMFLRMNGQD